MRNRVLGGQAKGRSSVRALMFPALLAAVGVAVSPARVRAEDGLYTVAKVVVDVTASDAVAAKDQAMRRAEEIAIRALFKRLTPMSSADRLPDVKPAMIGDMLDGVSIRSEQISGTRYIASLDVAFRPNAVRRLMQSYDLPIAEDRAPSVKVLPIVLTEQGIRSEGKEGWRKAWDGVDFGHSPTPATLAQLPAELNGEQLSAILGGDAASLSDLGRQVGAEKLVLAVAGLTENGREFTTRLFGADAVGRIDLSRTDRIHDGDTKEAARLAAAIGFRVIEGRWSVMRDKSEGGAEVLPWATPAASKTIEMVVEFSGMREWQSIRSKLMSMPGMHSVDIGSISARRADVTLAYDGGRDRLAQELEGRGFTISEDGGAFILSAN